MLHRLGLRPGHVAPRMAPRAKAHGRAVGRDHRGRRRCPRPCPLARHDPPRRQAGEHHARRVAPADPARLRAGLDRTGVERAVADRGGHAGLHVARAGPGRGAPDRRPDRHLQPGRGALRHALRSEAVPVRERQRAAPPGPRGRAPAPPAGRPVDPPRARADLPEGDGQEDLRSLHHGRRPGRRTPPGHPGRRLQARPVPSIRRRSRRRS